MIVTFKDLDVWNESIRLAKMVYSITSSFPKSEQFGLVSQLRRAVVSISANIAEGHGRGTRRDYNRFVTIALGSAREVDSLLTLSIELAFTDRNKVEPCMHLLNRICGMLYSLRNRLNVG